MHSLFKRLVHHCRSLLSLHFHNAYSLRYIQYNPTPTIIAIPRRKFNLSVTPFCFCLLVSIIIIKENIPFKEVYSYMITYYQEGPMVIRSMKESDIEALHNGFSAQGEIHRLAVLQKYFEEQSAGKRYVFIGEWDGLPVGYVTLIKEAEDGPYAHNGVPHVCDFNVLIPYRGKGIGSRIMDAMESVAFEMCDSVCLGVGLHPGYGNAQRMYAKRGYIPDGSGVWYNGRQGEGGERMENGDDLILYMAKQRPRAGEVIYYQDSRLTIRSLREEDIPEIQAGFRAEGWEKSLSTLEKYLREDLTEKRRVFLAVWDGNIAGYTTLMKEAEHGPYAHNGVPYVCDFTIFSPYRNQGIGSRVMDAVERIAFETSDSVCLGVGLYKGYGSAQRMYAKRGYIPDGSGVWYLNNQVGEYADCFNDDDLILYMSKTRVKRASF